MHPKTPTSTHSCRVDFDGFYLENEPYAMNRRFFTLYPITSIKSEIKYSPKMILVKLQLVLRISDIKITKMVRTVYRLWQMSSSYKKQEDVDDYTQLLPLLLCRAGLLVAIDNPLPIAELLSMVIVTATDN
ncbi:E3 ubiquitin-protein ligase UBR4-like isoform X1 [Halichondria panicea]|uniref:E3 ubiquitin-protein ligase UBR4-like isoform X1 n=1 Tax=Halichondria panicea TaxID=6063 RepID=UPI00312B342B